MNYKEKLNQLHIRSSFDSDKLRKIREVQDIDLIFDHATPNSLNEYSNFMLKIMQRYNIGKYVSKKFWGYRGYQDIQSVLLGGVKKMFDGDKKVEPSALYDELKSDVTGKQTRNYPAYTYARVARTEGKRMSVIYQLETMRDNGLKYVDYRTRGDSKVRDGHKMLNGRTYKIEYLLSPEGEKDRIPIDPNCRCRYVPNWKDAEL